MLQTELHRHMDISTRLTTLLEFAQVRGIEPVSTSLDSFRRKIVIRKPMKDLAEVLDQFLIFAKVLDHPDALERVAFEAIEDCYREGTRQVELRWSPSFVSEGGGLDWNTILQAFLRGREKALEVYPDVKAGFILIASRDFGREQVQKTIEFYLKNREWLIGFDLAGDEAGYPAKGFAEDFKPLRELAAQEGSGVHITIHAGEAAGPESVWESIELLGAERIGHGIRSIEDPKLVKFLADRQICLEVCPTSNVLTGATPSDLTRHPLPQLFRAGVPVSINTDDPTIFGVDLPAEIDRCRQEMGLSDDEIRQIHALADFATFLT